MCTGVFNFKLPDDKNFFRDNPDVPKPNTKEWFLSKEGVELKGKCIELAEFLSQNKKITKVSQLRINTRYDCVYNSQDTLPSSRAIEILTAAAEGKTVEEIDEIAKRPYLFQR